MTNLLAELNRRNVFRVAIAYAVLSWLVLQVGDTLAPALHLPGWVNSLLAFFVILGFPFAVFFAWAFELTPDGIKKEKDVDRTQSITGNTARTIDRSIIALLVVALAYFGWSTLADHEPAVGTNIASNPGSAGVAATSLDSSGPSIAVLPFVNMSSDPEQEYFSDGLSEELLNLLAKIPALRVSSRTSAFSYKGREITIPQVGRELNVNHVLEGSVRKSGDKIRITAQLIGVENDAHLWSETWDRTLDDVFLIQDEIASVVVEQLKIELLGEVPRVDESTPEAYALLLQARHLSRMRAVASYDQALGLVQNALEIDPDYASAWAELGAIYFRAGALDTNLTARGSAKLGEEASLKALELDPDNVQALANLGGISLAIDYDVEKARSYSTRALQLSPSDDAALIIAANIGMVTGDFETAIHWAGKAAGVDPLSSGAYISIAYPTYFLGKYEDAIRGFRKALEINPQASGLHYYIASVLYAQGKYEEALARVAMEAEDGFRLTNQAMSHWALGNIEESDAALQALNELSDEWAYQRIQVYAARNEIDKAFEWFDIAIEIRDRGLNLTLGDPVIDNLRDDPRFADVLHRLNRSQFQ